MQLHLVLHLRLLSQFMKTLVIGIDVGSETHFAWAFNLRGYEFSRKLLEFSNTEEGFETLRTWIMELKEKHRMDKVKPGMELIGSNK